MSQKEAERYMADEVFLTGTACEVIGVRQLDHCQIGTGSPGPITNPLKELSFDQVHGRKVLFPEWLSYVRHPVGHS